MTKSNIEEHELDTAGTSQDGRMTTRDEAPGRANEKKNEAPPPLPRRRFFVGVVLVAACLLG